MNIQAEKLDVLQQIINSGEIIFHMYDDRGLDIIEGNIGTIEPVYTKFKNWILESNRDEIDVAFNH